MTSVASETLGLVFWEQEGTAYAAVTGPESRSGTAPVPEDATFVGIQFAVGTSLRAVAAPALLDSGIVLPDVSRRSFWLDGRRWETPHADDAEALVNGLIRDGVVVRDPLVAEALRGRPTDRLRSHAPAPLPSGDGSQPGRRPADRARSRRGAAAALG